MDAAWVTRAVPRRSHNVRRGHENHLWWSGWWPRGGAALSMAREPWPRAAGARAWAGDGRPPRRPCDRQDNRTWWRGASRAFT